MRRERVTDAEGSRFATVVRTLAALLFAVLVSGASSASAAYIHPEATYEFGADGTSGTSFSGGYSLAFNQANKRLYVLEQEGSPRKIHGFHFNSPGSFSALGGLLPFEVNSGGGDPDIAVDNSAGGSANNIYYIQDGDPLVGFNSAGTALPAFSPEGGEKCGTAVDSAGHIWVGNYSGPSVEEFNPSGGAPINSISTAGQGSPCDVEIDRSNNDLYVSYYSPEFGHGIDRYTAASGYSIASDKVFSTAGNAKIAINPVKHRLYAASGGTVHSFDTETGAEVESFGSNFTRGGRGRRRDRHGLPRNRLEGAGMERSCGPGRDDRRTGRRCRSVGIGRPGGRRPGDRMLLRIRHRTKSRIVRADPSGMRTPGSLRPRPAGDHGQTAGAHRRDDVLLPNRRQKPERHRAGRDQVDHAAQREQPENRTRDRNHPDHGPPQHDFRGHQRRHALLLRMGRRRRQLPLRQQNRDAAR